MTKEQLEALKDYIKALIEDKLDDGNSSDEGLISWSALNKAETKLDNLVE